MFLVVGDEFEVITYNRRTFWIIDTMVGNIQIMTVSDGYVS